MLKKVREAQNRAWFTQLCKFRMSKSTSGRKSTLQKWANSVSKSLQSRQLNSNLQKIHIWWPEIPQWWTNFKRATRAWDHRRTWTLKKWSNLEESLVRWKLFRKCWTNTSTNRPSRWRNNKKFKSMLHKRCRIWENKNWVKIQTNSTWIRLWYQLLSKTKFRMFTRCLRSNWVRQMMYHHNLPQLTGSKISTMLGMQVNLLLSAKLQTFRSKAKLLISKISKKNKRRFQNLLHSTRKIVGKSLETIHQRESCQFWKWSKRTGVVKLVKKLIQMSKPVMVIPFDSQVLSSKHKEN